jgi:hypothetical protein
VAVYHFTVHAYRTWSPDHPRGYVRRDEGVQPPDPERADEYDRNAKFSPVTFDRTIQEILILGTYDVCRRRAWRFHGGGTDPTHYHFVVSWHLYVPWNDVLTRVKNVASLLLGRALNQPGRRWFVTRSSRKRVRNRKHFDHLLDTYLPDHRGLFWREGQALPEDVYGILDGPGPRGPGDTAE